MAKPASKTSGTGTGNPANGLASVFTRSDNWLLRSLFWLSKELPSERLLPSINADSDRLKTIADELENRYLRVVELEPADDAIDRQHDHHATNSKNARDRRTFRLVATPSFT